MDRKTKLSRRQFVRYVSAGVACGYVLGCRAVPRAGEPGPRPEAAGPAEWDTLADLALARIRRSGAEYGDIRILDTTEQTIRGEDRRLADVNDRRDIGFGVRVLWHGAWGFAASAVLTADEVRTVADLAIEIAQGSHTLVVDPVRLALEPIHRDTVVTPRQVEPFDVPLSEKTDLVLSVMEALHQGLGITRSAAYIWAQRDVKLFASTEGTRLRFDLLATQAGCSATALHEGRFASRRFATPILRRGYEHVLEANLFDEAPRVAAQAVEKVAAPAVEPATYDLVLDPEHLALVIHETCGHASELDRALGYEANFAGTTFLTPDKLGSFRYGSKHVNLVADNTEPETLAATGYDDDGVACQRWPIVQAGVFVGYSTNREVAPKIGAARSCGCCRADSWASVPILRMPNAGLEPGSGHLDDLIGDVRRGIYIEGYDSFSIDQQRSNFQFGGDAFWLIENGRRTHMLRDVIYHGITPEFWARCDAVADASHRRRFGFNNCGKGQPMQSGWMTHAASLARFRGVKVIAGGTEP